MWEVKIDREVKLRIEHLHELYEILCVLETKRKEKIYNTTIKGTYGTYHLTINRGVRKLITVVGVD